jgi:hypothetical protein
MTLREIGLFVLDYFIALVFYALLSPLVMMYSRATGRVMPVAMLQFSRWLLLPGLQVCVVWVLGLPPWHILWSLLFNLIHILKRMMRVRRGETPDDQTLLQALFVAAHGEKVSEGDQIELGDDFDPRMFDR